MHAFLPAPSRVLQAFARLMNAVRSTESTKCFGPRVVRRVPTCDELLYAPLEMERDFLVELRAYASASEGQSEQAANAAPDFVALHRSRRYAVRPAAVRIAVTVLA